jgi:hypothetical protein
MPDTPPKRSLNELLYRSHEGGDAEDLAVAASGWLDAVHAFGVDALGGGVPTSEVLPAVVQMLEGWMVARDAASLATTWAALDGAVTVLERRLAQVRDERDRLATLSEALLREKRRRRQRRRNKRQHGKG